MKKHFVTFASPGTFMAETSTQEIDSWNVDKAKEMADSITERYGAKPYGFYFTTRSRNDDELDSKVTDRSGMYYIRGEIKTLQEIKDENNPENRILIANMESNHYERIIRSAASETGWRFCVPFTEKDQRI